MNILSLTLEVSTSDSFTELEYDELMNRLKAFGAAKVVSAEMDTLTVVYEAGIEDVFSYNLIEDNAAYDINIKVKHAEVLEEFTSYAKFVRDEIFPVSGIISWKKYSY